MAIEDDVFVIGGGIAGMTAALAAAETGASVRLARKKESTLRQATGLADVLGYVESDLVAKPFEALADLPADHPYSIVGESVLRDGLSRFDGVTGDAYRGRHTERNALVLTQGGTIKPTARYPDGMSAGLASDERDVLLVGFENLRSFDAPFVAASLPDVDVPFSVRGETIPFPLDFPADATVTRYARAMDEDEDDVRTRLVQQVEQRHGGEPRIGFPAVLGLTESRSVRTALEDALGAAVFEVPMGPPSVPGMRLETHFQTALEAADVRIVRNEVVGYDGAGDHVESVTVDRNGQSISYSADQFVLATGGLVGGGMRSNRDAIREPVFDCHVPQPVDRYDWSAESATDRQPFATFGVEVTDRLQPVQADGTVEFDNLRAAGGVIGGADFATTGAGTGISLATGEAAGSAAGGDAT